MTQWIARKLYPRLDDVRRQREIRFLMVTVLICLFTCAAIAGIMYWIGTQPPGGH